eukprot:scaffold213210_cov17-Prasinocladus_malaysianus.AAC.1
MAAAMLHPEYCMVTGSGSGLHACWWFLLSKLRVGIESSLSPACHTLAAMRSRFRLQQRSLCILLGFELGRGPVDNCAVVEAEALIPLAVMACCSIHH